MSARTIQARLQAALEARGFVVDAEARTRKYTVMRPRPTVAVQPARYFLGKAGALRYSSIGNATMSVPVERIKLKLLEESPG